MQKKRDRGTEEKTKAKTAENLGKSFCWRKKRPRVARMIKAGIMDLVLRLEEDLGK